MSADSEKFLDKMSSLGADTELYSSNSKKSYLQGSRPTIQVPVREMELTPTQAATGLKDNPTI